LAIRDFPFTGMGLNVFRKALPALYTVYPIPRDVDFVHAHNHLLQAAIDLGLPGLIAYLALWWGAAYALFAAWRATADPYLRAVSIGLGAGWVAEFMYGLTDVITFGAKLGIFFWFALVLAISLYRVTVVETRPCRVSAVGKTALGAVDEPAR
jgi:putative inorganic carbon (HCO3(-)) transporter